MNTDYLLSLTEEDAEREQKMLYRFSKNSHHSVLSKKKLICSQYFSLDGRPCWAANTDPVRKLRKHILTGCFDQILNPMLNPEPFISRSPPSAKYTFAGL